MAKAGMRRPSPYDPDNHGTNNHQRMHRPKNEQAQVPENVHNESLYYCYTLCYIE